MLLQENFSIEHIRELQKTSHRDPILLERTIYAFGLLEALARVKLPFIFKGGTSLMLLTQHPRRLSTDIDIIVDPDTNLDQYLKQAAEIFPFRDVEEQIRIGKNQIVKRHFKFVYDSPINEKPLYILLDVLFEHNHYTELVQKKIQGDLLLTEPEYLPVTLPSANCILADKLTAFAPHTTGIPLNVGKDMEIMKQFYDVSTLLDTFTDFWQVKNTYEQIVQAEIDYRGIDKNSENCLKDTFETALCIASRGKTEKEEYSSFVKGIRELRGHIYTENYTPEIAAIRAPEIMYMAACLLSNTAFVPVEDSTKFLDEKLEQKPLESLRYLRKINSEAYAYAVKTDRIMMTVET